MEAKQASVKSQQQIAGLQHQIAGLQQQIAGFQQEIEGLQQQIAEIQQQPEVSQQRTEVSQQQTGGSQQQTQPEILGADTQITDASLFTYMSLMKSLQGVHVGHEVNIKICLQSCTPDVTECLTLILKNKFNVYEMKFDLDWKRGTTNSTSAAAIKEILQRHKLTHYKGPVTSGMQIPNTVEFLFAHIQDEQGYKALQKYLSGALKLQWLWVIIDLAFDATILQPLPPGCVNLRLFLPNVETDADIARASTIAMRLQPTPREYQVFHGIHFPRCLLGSQSIERLITGLQEVTVWDRGCISFPSSCKPSYDEVEDNLQEMTKNTLCCNIYWGKERSNQVNLDGW